MLGLSTTVASRAQFWLSLSNWADVVAGRDQCLSAQPARATARMASATALRLPGHVITRPAILATIGLTMSGIRGSARGIVAPPGLDALRFQVTRLPA